MHFPWIGVSSLNRILFRLLLLRLRIFFLGHWVQLGALRRRPRRATAAASTAAITSPPVRVPVAVNDLLVAEPVDGGGVQTAAADGVCPRVAQGPKEGAQFAHAVGTGRAWAGIEGDGAAPLKKTRLGPGSKDT